MKWFKHMTDASDDELLSFIIDEYGLEGYGRYWLLLEAVAKQMDETSKCSAEYSWKKWQVILRGKRNKLETFLKRFGNKLEMNEKQNGNVLEIKIPKLLKMRDNYTANLQASNNPACKQEVEVEVEVEEIKKTNKKGNRYSDQFETFWSSAYPRNGASKAMTFKSWQKAILFEEPEAIIKAAAEYSQYCERENVSIAHATTWLNQERWTVDHLNLTTKPKGNGNEAYCTNQTTGGGFTAEAERIIAKWRIEDAQH